MIIKNLYFEFSYVFFQLLRYEHFTAMNAILYEACYFLQWTMYKFYNAILLSDFR